MTDTSSPDAVETSSRRPARLRDVVARNVAWNWIGTAVEMVAGFVVAPFLVRRLGDTGYGLWIVIGSLSGYFSLIDLGLRGSLGRQLAVERAQNNYQNANRVLSSGLAILSVVDAITIGATLIVAVFLNRLFDIPPALVDEARLALLLVGINLALSFPLQVFDGNLWSSQRFDILNFVDIPATCVRVGLTFALVHDASDIVALAVITLATTIGSGGAKAIVSFRLDRWLHVHPKHVGWSEFKNLFEYGIWNFVLTVARISKTQLSPILIGTLLGIAFVTPFSIARRLQDYAHKVLWTATGVLMPVATRFHARSETVQQRNLFLQGAKYSTTVAIFFLAYFACVGDAVISLWMGPAFAYAGALLIIFALGEFLQMTQSVTGSIILATAQHRFLAIVSVVETAVTVALIFYMSTEFGLIGVAAAIAVPQVVFSGVTMLVHGCKATGVGAVRYAKEAVFPPAIAALPAVALLGLLSSRMPPQTWSLLVGYSAIYALVYSVGCWIVLKPGRSTVVV